MSKRKVDGYDDANSNDEEPLVIEGVEYSNEEIDEELIMADDVIDEMPHTIVNELSDINQGGDEEVIAENTRTLKRPKHESKRPLSMWTLYLRENRERIMRENPEQSMGEITKIAAEQYKNLSMEEKSRLEDIIKLEKAHFDGKSTIIAPSLSDLSKDLIIPQARVKRIIKLDPEIKNLSREAVTAITKATELFLAHIGMVSVQSAASRGAKTVRDIDVVHAIHIHDNLQFLRLDFPRNRVESTKDPKKKTSVVALDTSGASSILSYFQNDAETTLEAMNKE